MRGAVRPRTLIFQAAIQALYLCPVAALFHWGLSYLVAGFSVPGAMAPYGYGLILLSPLGAGLAIATILREPLKHPMAWTLPGIRRRFRLWHAALGVVAAAGFAIGQGKLLAAPAPLVPAFALALAASVVTAGALGGQTRRKLDRVFVALTIVMAVAGSCFCVETAAAVRRWPWEFTAFGLAVACFSLAIRYERERVREDTMARRPRLPSQPSSTPPSSEAKPWIVVPGNPNLTLLFPVLGGLAYGLFMTYRGWVGGERDRGPAHAMAAMTITAFMMFCLEPTPGRILVRNDRSPVSRPQRLQQAYRRCLQRLAKTGIATVLACWGFTMGFSRGSLQPDLALIALALEIGVVAYSLVLVLQFASERWLRPSWVRPSRVVILLIGMAPCMAPFFVHDAHGPTATFVNLRFAAMALALGGLFQISARLVLRSHFLRGDLLAREI